ncbi:MULTISPECIES: lipopolysaccharide biosynthesis protein [Streptomyces]|jgi:capsular polysaccharide biosynthesis protein|uniref:Capsular polysaccharide biosynthesis protein n=1 Tax=Streptomyces nymphaeiformis TaxID=2663842 RepID=A0A7W7U1P1_9ACTN|nr:lipopolysaccharide biosynthesis protein [Streptomyces nymphaeiformis]MBB4983369.1 capsular polysaccharide biosynthesis protein [Streptomyces nymphaeiformis]
MNTTPPRALLPAGLRSPGRWAVLPAAVLAGAVLGGGYGALKTPEYAATSYVIVVPAEKADPAGALGFAQAYGRVATDIAVTGDAQVWAGVTADTLRKNVQAATSPDAPMISITARAAKPAQAVSMADGVARALILNSSHVAGSTGVKVVQFSRATKPVAPVSPSAPLSALVGGCAGGLLGGLALLVRPKRSAARGEARHSRQATAPAGSASVPAPAAAAHQTEAV